MDTQVIIMPGSNRVDMPLLKAAADDFGWTVHIAKDVRELTAAQDSGKVAALLFQHDSIAGGSSWLETISYLKAVAPELRLVPCNHFSEAIDYPKLCRAGIFYALWMPLHRNEVRQCFGFVWEAEKRLTLVPRKTPDDIRSLQVQLRARAAG
jgi:hypothetical protein